MYYLNLVLVGYGATTGFIMEMIFLRFDLLSYATENIFSTIFPPGWVWSLYFLFSLTYNFSLNFLNKNAALPFVFGLFGGPLSYYVGVKLDAVTFSFPEAIFILGAFWGAYLYVLFKINRSIKNVVDYLLDERVLSQPFTIFYDNICPICSREIKYLKGRKKTGEVEFFEIKSKEHLEKSFKDIDYLSAMKEIHAIGPDGKVLKGIDAFAELYARTNLILLSVLLKAPILEKLCSFVYLIWAKYRLKNRCKIRPLE